MNENKQMDQIKSFIEENKWVVGIVVLVIAVFAVLALKNNIKVGPSESEKSRELAEGCLSEEGFSQTTGKPCKEEEVQACKDGEVFDRNTGEPCVGVVDKTATPATGASSYDAALKTYAGKTIAFDDSCTSSPATLNAAVGSKVLLANNSQKALEISIQNKRAVLRPYHYMTSLVAVAGEYPVMCNGKSAATVSAK